MKNTTLKFVLLWIALFALFSMAFAPLFEVTLDPDLEVFVNMFASFLMTGLFKLIGGWLKIDMTDLSAIAAAGLAAVFVAVINGFLRGVPPSFDLLATYVMRILVILLGSMGFFSAKKHTVQAFQAARLKSKSG